MATKSFSSATTCCSELAALVLDVSAKVIDRATELRARYGFKSPDAIHLATAIESGANEFLTGDAGLARCTEVAVTVLVPTAT